MHPILDIVSRHRQGEPVGLPSICSAHPLVLEATFRHAKARGSAVTLVEATSNQVNQFGGYTGMTPADFRAFALGLAAKAGLSEDRVQLGGDHLGPNAWQDRPAEEAMALAETMIADYVAAGFGKIHLDCSMSCADDPVPLPEDVVARRAARLCAVAERAARDAGVAPPVYVIGTEVPVPGGAQEELETLEVTAPDAARNTLAAHRAIFEAEGLAEAWPRVIALVVQPGVEFDHDKVIVYDPAAATALSAVPLSEDHIVFEAHSTDYQPAGALQALVRDHFAILKVGPGVTFALREALWSLDALAAEWIQGYADGVRATMLAVMQGEPRYWKSYYHEQGRALELTLQYSLSDRIRYYWPDAAVQTAVARLIAVLAENPPPAPLVSQHLPLAFLRLRDRGAALAPEALVMEHVAAVLDDYHNACNAETRV
ncbi:D-tagatose-bisphosphate aldolase, class II, non-catalytic subunit [Sphingomonas sp. LM7]|uniref:D-tagatose-bisphosphate aldolase, class II, non-catalytic subunit n=1 Tax=Sphingomonas sp. LM7 TaxID=1938607 RepID=UPI000983E79D|nr:D-tagatose-bisphosphate aldolase, class II, non-catalytic subunit [Sphingomonas sp. LM7]AQR75055.1 D-tagatose-bisphosphate aldolase, class II, non-catalytic subunit [Sphingomonas sp. LM7]